MAIYHLRATMISRSQGRSATAASAYRSAERIVDERTGQVFDYERRSGVEHTHILAPDNAPEWVHNRAELWNAVEAAETRKNSQVAREVRVALPYEFSQSERIEAVTAFCNEHFVCRGMVADIAWHNPGQDGDERNYHAHIMLTTREITEEGFTSKNRDWNKVELLEDWRESWANTVNSCFERNNLVERVDHRTLAEQREDALERAAHAEEHGDRDMQVAETLRALELDRRPLPQLSAGAWQMKERGEDIESVRNWYDVKVATLEIKETVQEMAGYFREVLGRGRDHVSTLADKVREAASSMDFSAYADRAMNVVKGFRQEEQHEQREVEKQTQQLENERLEQERRSYNRGFSHEM